MLKLSLPENLYFGTKTDYVVEAIRTAILVGDLLPGTKVTEQQVKDLLKVSSSPVREAFHQLEAEGLLTRNPHVGTKVTEMDIQDAKELYFIQSLLQGTAVQISTKNLKEEDIHEAERLNNEIERMCKGRIDVKGLRVVNYKLHMILCGAKVYPWLTRLISALWIRFPSQSLWLMPKRPMMSFQQHEKIIKAIKKRDELLAGSLMKGHLESSMKALYG
ncbi:MAG: GntR family transcriptional regulator [Thermodesulfobacteriota bacterium]|nr:GntR family transcriptional regulator [Thermodesulfobacteriota bacterium]